MATGFKKDGKFRPTSNVTYGAFGTPVAKGQIAKETIEANKNKKGALPKTPETTTNQRIKSLNLLRGFNYANEKRKNYNEHRKQMQEAGQKYTDTQYAFTGDTQVFSAISGERLSKQKIKSLL